MAKNFKTLREKMSPESQGRSRALANKYRAEMREVPQQQPANLGLFGAVPGTSEVFDNKKATHREVANFVANIFNRQITPMKKELETYRSVLDAIFLYLGEVGICGVKVTQKDISEHYQARLKEEIEKQKASGAAPSDPPPPVDGNPTGPPK